MRLYEAAARSPSGGRSRVFKQNISDGRRPTPANEAHEARTTSYDAHRCGWHPV